MSNGTGSAMDPADVTGHDASQSMPDHNSTTDSQSDHVVESFDDRLSIVGESITVFEVNATLVLLLKSFTEQASKFGAELKVAELSIVLAKATEALQTLATFREEARSDSQKPAAASGDIILPRFSETLTTAGVGTSPASSLESVEDLHVGNIENGKREAHSRNLFQGLRPVQSEAAITEVTDEESQLFGHLSKLASLQPERSEGQKFSEEPPQIGDLVDNQDHASEQSLLGENSVEDRSEPASDPTVVSAHHDDGGSDVNLSEEIEVRSEMADEADTQAPLQASAQGESTYQTGADPRIPEPMQVCTTSDPVIKTSLHHQQPELQNFSKEPAQISGDNIGDNQDCSGVSSAHHDDSETTNLPSTEVNQVQAEMADEVSDSLHVPLQASTHGEGSQTRADPRRPAPTPVGSTPEPVPMLGANVNAQPAFFLLLQIAQARKKFRECSADDKSLQNLNKKLGFQIGALQNVGDMILRAIDIMMADELLGQAGFFKDLIFGLDCEYPDVSPNVDDPTQPKRYTVSLPDSASASHLLLALMNIMESHGVYPAALFFLLVPKREEASEVFLKTGSDLFLQPLEHVNCSNWHVSGSKLSYSCGSAFGTLQCARCQLVAYCSKECQREHWKVQHKHDCRKLATKDREKEDVDPGRGTSASASPSNTSRRSYFAPVWDQTPAYGVIGEPSCLPSGELPITLYFDDCFDLNCVIETLHQIPLAYPGKVIFSINHKNPTTVARNIILLSLMLTHGADALDSVIALWYSARLTPGQFLQLQSIVYRLVWSWMNPMNEPKDPSGRRKCMDLNDLKELLEEQSRERKTRGFKPFYFGAARSSSIVCGTFNSIDVCAELIAISFFPWGGLQDRGVHKPQGIIDPATSFWDDQSVHAQAFAKFREDGLVLPYSHFAGHHTLPNPMLYSSRDGRWIVPDDQSPFYAWPLRGILQSARGHSVPRNDIFGALFFHVKDRLRVAAATLRHCKISLQFTNLDDDQVLKLHLGHDRRPTYFRINCPIRRALEGTAAQIEISLLCFWDCLDTRFKLSPGASTLIMLVSHWAPSTRDPSDKEQYRRLLGKIKFDSWRRMHEAAQSKAYRELNSVNYLLREEMRWLWADISPLVELVVEQATRSHDASTGLVRRKPHQIVPERPGLPFKVPAAGNVPATYISDKTLLYSHLTLTALEENEFFLEWTFAQPDSSNVN